MMIHQNQHENIIKFRSSFKIKKIFHKKASAAQKKKRC